MTGDGARERESLDAIRRAAASLLPELMHRLTEHGLGELEERHGDVRVSVRAGGESATSTAGSDPAAETAAPVSTGEAPPAPEPGAASVVSPAVGVFVYGEGLGPGLEVNAGDPLGHVEMLGVQYDVRAPETGRVSHLVAETGEAVEYGQVLIEVERDVKP